MRQAVLVSTARTPIGKAYRGAFNNTSAQVLGGHAVMNAVERAKVDPAEIVGERYGVSRESQDEFAFQSQQRTAIAQQAGKFDNEIVALTSTMLVQDKETKEISQREVTLEQDEGNRPSTTMDGRSALFLRRNKYAT